VTLTDIKLALRAERLPPDVAEFLAEADARLNRLIHGTAYWGSGFVPSDFVTVYHALREVAQRNLAAGNCFCEWGSGFGVVTILADMLGFQACGIEIDRDLVDVASELAEDFDAPVEFIHGSFIPPGHESNAEQAYAEHDGGVVWLSTEVDRAYDELGLDPDDFDLIFAYPWPGEEVVVDDLFARCAADGALLLTYGQGNSVRLQRKVQNRIRAADHAS